MVWVNYNKKEEKHYKKVLLRKNKLNTIEVLISEALINLCISLVELASVTC